MAEQQTMLRMTAMQPEEGIGFLRRLVTAWKQRRADEVHAFLKDRLALTPIMLTYAVAGRNRNWFPRVYGLAQEEEPTLIVAGAFHMVGSGGLPALLRAQGYSVTAADVLGE
jgi:uncharacterized protein